MISTIKSFLPLSEYYVLLSQTEVNISPSEIHGIFCGLICSGRNLQGNFWLDNLLSYFNFYTKISKKHKTTLLSLYSDICYQLMGKGCPFDLLLPSTDLGLNSRADALSIWCQGFLSGLSVNTTFDSSKLPPAVSKHLKIISGIAQLDFDPFDTSLLSKPEFCSNAMRLTDKGRRLLSINEYHSQLNNEEVEQKTQFRKNSTDSKKDLADYETIQSFVTCAIPFIYQTFNPSMKIYVNGVNSLQ